MEEVLVHNSDGELVSLFDIPGTKVRRIENLPFKVHLHFPIGEIKEITPPCGKLNKYQDPDREFCHVIVNVVIDQDLEKVTYCFHPYRNTLEIVYDE